MRINLEIVVFYVCLFSQILFYIWLWAFGMYGADYNLIPSQITSMTDMQPSTPLVGTWTLWGSIYDFRMWLGICCMSLLLFFNNIGKYGFVVFLFSGPILLHNSGWLYELQWIDDLQWALQMLAGCLVGISFFGKSSSCWTWGLTTKQFFKPVK